MKSKRHTSRKLQAAVQNVKIKEYFIQIKFLLLVTALRMKSKRHTSLESTIVQNFNKYKPFLLGLMFFWTSGSYAQDPVFSQFFLSPLHNNPAFCGLDEAPRFSLQYRNQWPAIEGNFNTYTTTAFSYDQFFGKWKSGIGAHLLADNSGDGILRSYKASAVYGYQAPLYKKGYYIKGGLEFGLAHYSLDWDRFIFGDQIDPEYGPVSPGGTPYPSAELEPSQKGRTYIDVGAGILYYTPVFYLGVSSKHINTPDNSLLDQSLNPNDGLPVRWTILTGGDIRLSRAGRTPQVFSPTLLYALQSSFWQLNIGGIYQISSLQLGLFYRQSRQNSDALIAMLGFKKGIYRFSYSFDYTLSDLGISQGGSHEIGIGINLAPIRQRSKVRTDCFDAFR